MQIEKNKYYNEGLQYYIFLELGSEKDFIKNIKEHGTNYIKYCYDKSYEDTYYQASRGNIFYPSSI